MLSSFSADWEVLEPGSMTETPSFFTMESETMTKVASRKNMMSISGTISIRAFFLPPRVTPPPPPAMV